MTTYPLSEAATVHVGDADKGDLRGHGTLEECVALIKGLSPDDRRLARVSMDNLDLEYGPGEISELIDFLRQEKPGLSNQEIAALPNIDR